MSWIEVVHEEQAEEPLRSVYLRVRAARGHVANVLKAQSLRPEALDAHQRLYRELMFGRGSSLTRRVREMIAVVVSKVNRCHY